MNMLKKVAAELIASLMLFASVNAFAADNISVVLNGETVVFDNAQPIIYEDRTLIPVRAVFEKAKCEVIWDESNKTAIISNDEKIVSITVNQKKIQVYNINSDSQDDISIDVPAMIIDGSIMIPLRAVSEAFNARVDWQSTTKTANIKWEG